MWSINKLKPSKNVFVLRIGDYRPDLCKYTLPTIQHWAHKIGATYCEITGRRYPDAPSITYEKLQVHTLGAGADWNVLIDADTMIHPALPDLTSGDPATILFRLGFDVRGMFNEHPWFLRDGRFQGIAGNFIVSSKMTHDLWTPFDMPLSEAVKYTNRNFILDELCLSLNLARYGLKYSGLAKPIYEMIDHFGNETETDAAKLSQVEKAKALFDAWGFAE